MIATRQTATMMSQNIPYRFYSDEASMVYECCQLLQQAAGRDLKGVKTNLDDLLHLDNNASQSLRYATSSRLPVSIRASVRMGGGSLLPVYWTVVPEPGGYQWYGMPVASRDRIEGRLNELEQIVASFHDIVFELDKDGIFRNFWVKDPSVLFVPPSVFLGKPMHALLEEHYMPTAANLLPAYEESVRYRKTVDVEYRLPGLDGLFNCRYKPILNPDAEMVGMLVIITDITQQRDLETNLRLSEERYRDLFENANDIIYIIDENSRVTSMNRMAEKLLEYKESEMVGQSSHRFFAPEKLAMAVHLGEKKKAGLVLSTVYESEFISCSGRRIPVEISSRPILKGGQVTGIHVTARDIGQQKQSEQELAKSEAKFRFLSEYARDMICLHRPNGDYIYVSPAVKQLLGYDPEDLTDKSPYDFFHPDDAATTIKDAHDKNSRGEEEPSVQFRFRRKDGTYIWLESVSKPIVEDGEVIYIQTNTRDINDRKLAEQQLVERDRLSSALAQISRMLLVGNTLEEGLQQCLPLLGSASRAECIFVLKFTGKGPQLFHIWCESNPCSVMEKQHLFSGVGLLLPAADQCRSGNTSEYQLATETNPAIRAWMEEMGYKSLLISPVVTSEGCWGAIGCGQKKSSRTYSKTVDETLTTFASSVSSVIEKNLRVTQLRDSEEKFKALFRNSLDIVFVLEPRGRLTYATPSLRKILGYEEAELMQEPCRNIVHPEERKIFDAALKKLASDHQHDLQLPLRILHRNGNWLWMEMKAQSKLSNPNINGIILSLRDISEYVEIEKTLKQYSDKITSMLHSITDGFISLDRNFQITMFNTVAQNLLEDNMQLVVGGNAWDLLPDARDSVSFISLNKAVNENRTIRYEQYVSSLNRWFDVSAFPYDDGLFIYFKDVSARKQQDRLLQLEKEVLEMHTGSEASLREIADLLLEGLEKINGKFNCAVFLVKNHLRDTVLLSSPDLTEVLNEFVETTPLDAAMTSYGRAILLRQQVIIPDISSSYLNNEVRQKAASMGIKAAWSIPIISSTNEVLGTFNVYYKVARTPTEEEFSMISRATHILTMIIENKQAAEKLRISNERYILATRAANEAIWDWDAEEEVSFWGEGFNTLFGYPSGLYSGTSQNWESRIHPEDRDRVLGNINKVLEGRDNGLFMEEYRFKKADGTYALVIDKAYCLYNEQGKVIRMIGSCEDITERKMLEEKLIQQEINKQKQIARAVVDVQENEREEIGKELHDNVNQLLSTAKLFLEVAQNDAEMRQDMIRRSSDTIMNAINEIRKISRSLMPASVSDLGLISSVKDLVQNINIAKQLVVDFRYDSKLEKLLGPKQKLMLFRIIQEQVNNVLKHAHASSLGIIISHNPNSTRLEIADNGIGFDLNLAKMKDGLGLSNIMSRAAIFNADVKVNTAPGKGCQLIIDLPNTLNKDDEK